ncbi:sensor histidine kinase [Maledivibacter halophilus]|uniref:histidine kinase n=1 Tax=Maledivibacter halophilus TaxID=36842 RepID=A0A1T5JR76_9FIRM|nr:sensor histidine kinase [Maledivibacter halophilus]SKC53931.1 Signal transduction histidine kinase [Maledivibacter halophilus]
MHDRDYYYVKIIKRVLAFTVLICTILSGILIYFSSNFSENMMLQMMEDNFLDNSKIYSGGISGYLQGRYNLLNTYAQYPLVKNMNWERVKKYFEMEVNLTNISNLSEDDMKSIKRFDNLFIVDSQGNKYSTDEENINVRNEEYFKNTMKGKKSISNIFISEKSGDLMATMAVPIWNKGEIVGALGGITNIETLSRMIERYKVKHKDSYSYIVDKNGYTICHPNRNFIGSENITKPSKNINEDFVKYGLYILNNDGGDLEYVFNGVSSNAYFSTISNTDNWKIVTIIPNKYIYGPIIKKTNKLLIIGALGILVIAAISLKGGQFIAIPMLKWNKDLEKKRKKLEEEIEYSNLKTEFFSNISHEFKTPLNIIFSTTQLMKFNLKKENSKFDITKLNNHVDTIKQNCYRLLRLINNILDLTKIDSGFMKLNLENGNIVSTIEDITLSTVEYVKSKSKKIVFDTDVEEKIMAFDSDKIERIILNLISNSIKFTKPNDSIEVNIHDKDEKIIISIKDTGIGIPKEKQKEIFERFTQVDSCLTRKTEGSGIGLSLVKAFVEMHDGKISLKSEYGKGTEFIIELPVKLVSWENGEGEGKKSNGKRNVEMMDIEFSDIYS